MATSTTTTTHKPSPEGILRMLNSHQLTAALRTAIELNVFTAIGDGAQQPASLAAKTGASERGLRILCDYLTIAGLLTKENGRYSLTQDCAIFLNRNSPAYLGGIADFLLGADSLQNFAKLTDAVRRGGTASSNGDNEKPNDARWINFAKTMGPLTGHSAAFIADLIDARSGKRQKVLDVAASHGKFGITIAQMNPNAHITALDWPNVLAVTVENAKDAGVVSRMDTISGSIFEAELGNGYDCVLLTNLLHHFDHGTCETMLRRVHAALKPGGKAVTLEFVPNEDRVTPPVTAAFSLMMLASTDKGDAYTFCEYQKIFVNAGFGRTTLHQVPDMPQQVLLSEK
ncbi:MAG: hypothetical protein PVS2B2_20080 [Candidatus Acidiferrum sp.]